MNIKNLRSNAPPKGSVKRTNKILWGDWKDHSARCVIYNNVDEAEQKLSEGASMSNDQFQQLMNQMTTIKSEMSSMMDTKIISLKEEMSSMEGRIYTNIGNQMGSMKKELKEDIRLVSAKLDKLTTVVKKNHPSDFN